TGGMAAFRERAVSSLRPAKCGICGGGYSHISSTPVGCPTARDKGRCGNRVNIRRDVLERHGKACWQASSKAIARASFPSQ
ncbi:hypothetical protein C1X73_32675, partial [Pseudomonas sp. FW305-130]